MEPQPYSELSDTELLALCCWREARGQSYDAKVAQQWSVKNRVNRPSWWGHDWHSVILKPWQYSSFNQNDPNEKNWPPNDGALNPLDFEAWQDSLAIAGLVESGQVPDPTSGATHYFDTSISFPAKWGKEAEWENTLNVGRLKFWKMRPPVETLDVEE